MHKLLHRFIVMLTPVILIATGHPFNSSARDPLTSTEHNLTKDQSFLEEISASADYNVLVNGQNVTVSATTTPIEKILREIGKQKNIKIFISTEFAPYNITDQFFNLTLENALERLLKNSSYSLVYGGDSQPASILELHILPSGSQLMEQPAIEESEPPTSLDDIQEEIETSNNSEIIKETQENDTDGIPEETVEILKKEIPEQEPE